MKTSRKTIFDLERRCDLFEEYDQIIADLRGTFIENRNLVFALDTCIRTWPHRQGATGINSYANSHGFSAFNNTSEIDILYTLELVINLLHWAPTEEKLSLGAFNIDFGMESQLKKECGRCVENIEYLLENINMRVREINITTFPQYVIYKRDAQVDAVIEAVPQLTDMLLSYLDVRSQNDEEVKKAVLKAIADYLEQKRKDGCYKGTPYSGLCEDLFTVFNNASIRHKNNKQWKLRKPARMKLYDQTFKAAIHLLQMEDVDAFRATVKEWKNKPSVGTETR